MFRTSRPHANCFPRSAASSQKHTFTDKTTKAKGSREICLRPQSFKGQAQSRFLSLHAPAASMSLCQRRGRHCASTIKTESFPFKITCAVTIYEVPRERGLFLASSSSLSASSLCDKASPQSTVRYFGAQR